MQQVEKQAKPAARRLSSEGFKVVEREIKMNIKSKQLAVVVFAFAADVLVSSRGP